MGSISLRRSHSIWPAIAPEGTLCGTCGDRYTLEDKHLDGHLNSIEYVRTELGCSIAFIDNLLEHQQFSNES